MTVGVLGANGRTGKCVVEEALARNLNVVAGVRGNYLFDTSKKLKIIQCDILDQKQVSSLVSQVDVVISVIGHMKGSPEFMQTEGITNVIRALNVAGKKRLISLTGTGVRLPADKVTLADKILNFSISLIDPKRINDGRKHAEIIQACSLDWTILRVLKLSNTKSKPFRLTASGPTKFYVSRKEVAKALLDIAENRLFIRESPIISKI